MEILVLLLFFSFYFGSYQKEMLPRFFFILVFLFISYFLRVTIDVSASKDYYSYYRYYKIENIENFSFGDILLNEPYLSILNKIFSSIYIHKSDVFKGMFYFNYFIVNIFFILLMLAKDIQVWKKVALFSLYYFLFTYVLLRNGIPYVILGYFIYGLYRNKKTLWIIVTPFMHISSLIPMILIFHKRKRYLSILIGTAILVFLLFFVGQTILNRPEFYLISEKKEVYSNYEGNFSLFHYLFFTAMMVFSFVSYLYLRKRFWNPVIITFLVLYIAGFYINPVVGFRFSPYLLMGLLFINVNDSDYKRTNSILNFFSIVLVFYFLFSLYDTHYL